MESTLLYDGKVELLFDEEPHQYWVRDTEAPDYKWARDLTVPGKRVANVTDVVGLLDKPGLPYWSANKAVERMLEGVPGGEFALPIKLEPGRALTQCEIDQLAKAARLEHTVQRDRAADLGTQIHRWLDLYNKVVAEKGWPSSPPNDERGPGVRAALRAYKKHSIQPVASEVKLYSRELNLAGTADAILANGIGDLKCRQSVMKDGRVYDAIALQLALYAFMACEMGLLRGPLSLPFHANAQSHHRQVIHVRPQTGRVKVYDLDDKDSKYYRPFGKDIDAALALRSVHLNLRGF